MTELYEQIEDKVFNMTVSEFIALVHGLPCSTG